MLSAAAGKEIISFIAANKRKLFRQSKTAAVWRKDSQAGRQAGSRRYVVVVAAEFPSVRRSDYFLGGWPENDYRRHIRSIDPIWTGIRKRRRSGMFDGSRIEENFSKCRSSRPGGVEEQQHLGIYIVLLGSSMQSPASSSSRGSHRECTSRKAIGSSVSTIWNFISTFRNARTNQGRAKDFIFKSCCAPFSRWSNSEQRTDWLLTDWLTGY